MLDVTEDAGIAEAVDEAAVLAAEREKEERVSALYDEFEEGTRSVRATRQLLTTLAARRRETTIKLRESGQTYRAIAERTGLSKRAIQQLLADRG